jgi:dTDP-4-dehydrorhamnose reductase
MVQPPVPSVSTPHVALKKESQHSPQAKAKPLAQRPASARPELILVIGSSGQLGRDLCRELRGLGTVVGACRTPDAGSLLPVPVMVDISRPASLRQAIRQVRPTLIVNAAGLTDVDVAETQPRLAQMVNATAPAIMAEEALRIGAGLVHFCSSMVFDGAGERPWRESDCPDPQNQYARTKLLGTQAILESDVAHIILRCGWLYSTHGDNYVRRLIDTLSYRNVVALANDHLGAPTSTNFLARLVANLLGTDALTSQPGTRRTQSCDINAWLSEQGGLYHASTLGRASKLEVGDQIVAACRQHALPIVLRKLEGRPLRDLPALAKIPGNCSLDPSRLALKFQLQLPHWQSDLNQQIDLMLSTHGLQLSGVA